MHSIASQIEELYMNNSRNDMNDSITTLIIESLVGPVLTPERLLVEHIVLISILHANVGTEVGRYLIHNILLLLVSVDELRKTVYCRFQIRNL